MLRTRIRIMQKLCGAVIVVIECTRVILVIVHEYNKHMGHTAI